MREFVNKTTNIPNADGNGFMTYVDLARVCLFYKADGFSTEEMYRRFKIVDKLESPPNQSGKISFEDAEVALLKKCEAAMKWNGMDRDIMGFGRYIKEEL